MGAWIEITNLKQSTRVHNLVAPLMGAWIEIIIQHDKGFKNGMSRPSWARGLK